MCYLRQCHLPLVLKSSKDKVKLKYYFLSSLRVKQLSALAVKSDTSMKFSVCVPSNVEIYNVKLNKEDMAAASTSMNVVECLYCLIW